MSNDPFDSGAQMEGPGAGPDVSNVVSGPAIALLVAGIINVLSSLGTVLYSFTLMLMPEQVLQQPGFQDNPAFQDLQNQPGGPSPAQAMAIGGIAYLVAGIIALIVAGVIVMGALKMKKLQSYGLSMTASILAMIPCLSSCCLIGLPVGIWCLTVLMKPEVKSAFR